jgi:hypothetical protein
MFPTVYTEHGPPADEDEDLVAVRLPADVADELTVATVWLSLRLDHQLPVAVLRRALLLRGLARTDRVLVDLERLAGRPGAGSASSA